MKCHEPAHCLLPGTCGFLACVILLPWELLRISMWELSHRSASPDKKIFHKVSECSSQCRSSPSQGPHRINSSPSVGWGRAPCPLGQPGKQLHTTAAEEKKERDALWEQHLPQRGSLKPWWCYECYHLFSVTVWSHMRSWGHLRCYRKSFLAMSYSQGYLIYVSGWLLCTNDRQVLTESE